MTVEAVSVRILEALERLAARGECITYGDLSAAVNGSYSARNIGWQLGPISKETFRVHAVFLSAIVVNEETDMPGDQFFTSIAFPCRGVNPPRAQWKKFWEKERDMVFEKYADDPMAQFRRFREKGDTESVMDLLRENGVLDREIPASTPSGHEFWWEELEYLLQAQVGENAK